MLDYRFYSLELIYSQNPIHLLRIVVNFIRDDLHKYTLDVILNTANTSLYARFIKPFFESKIIPDGRYYSNSIDSITGYLLGDKDTLGGLGHWLFMDLLLAILVIFAIHFLFLSINQSTLISKFKKSADCAESIFSISMICVMITTQFRQTWLGRQIRDLASFLDLISATLKADDALIVIFVFSFIFGTFYISKYFADKKIKNIIPAIQIIFNGLVIIPWIIDFCFYASSCFSSNSGYEIIYVVIISSILLVTIMKSLRINGPNYK